MPAPMATRLYAALNDLINLRAATIIEPAAAGRD
jgi:hypothetical protein